MSDRGSPWFAGAWRRRSIVVPDGEPTEPCEAWWLQSAEWFVDVRVARPGYEDNGLPYSATRAFAGRFEIIDGEVCWHLVLDTAGLAPRTDRAAAGGLYLSPDDPLLMIEDAPGRFREEWVQHSPSSSADATVGPDRIAVRLGDIHGAVWIEGAATMGRVWTGGGVEVAAVDGRRSGRSDQAAAG